MGELLCGRYRLIERLGEGGMAVVWRGYDEVLGRQVAVKLPATGLADDPEFVARLRQEAQAGARLSHPNIMSVHDYGEAHAGDGDVRPFVVMEMIEGETLRSCLTSGRRLSWRRAVTVAAEVAAAIAAAHTRGIVHRDISTSNVMLTPTGAKVLDFGISALAGEREPDNPRRLLGTPAYVAPERLAGREVTPAVDVYALGVLLYRALQGSLPWKAESTTGLLNAHLRLEPDPLPPIPGMPAEVAQLCLRCLAKDPADRPGSDELAAALAKLARIPAKLPPFAAAAANEAKGEAENEVTVGGRGTAVMPWRPFTPGLAPAENRQDTVILGRHGRYTLAAMGFAFALILAVGVAVARPDRAPEIQPAAATPACRVVYMLTSDTGDRFGAAVTVHNDGLAPVDAWQLEFGWPGDQTMVGADAVAWAQQGRNVVVRPASGPTPLAAGGSHRFALSGEYHDLNAMPADFALAGTPCQSLYLAQPFKQETGVSTNTGTQNQPNTSTNNTNSGKGKGKNKGKGGGGDEGDD